MATLRDNSLDVLNFTFQNTGVFKKDDSKLNLDMRRRSRYITDTDLNTSKLRQKKAS